MAVVMQKQFTQTPPRTQLLTELSAAALFAALQSQRASPYRNICTRSSTPPNQRQIADLLRGPARRALRIPVLESAHHARPPGLGPSRPATRQGRLGRASRDGRRPVVRENRSLTVEVVETTGLIGGCASSTLPRSTIPRFAGALQAVNSATSWSRRGSGPP